MLRLWFLILVLFCTGCVSIPPAAISPEIEEQELSDHVHFLAQPRLKGRKPRTYGSRVARQYIAEQFTAIGLEPWGGADSFYQPFSIGTNVIGVLPGSDPELAHEFVVVSAHYDHLGKTKKGLCLGASDNASAVAAIMEIAEHLSKAPQRPRRSICFAAFDLEEHGLLGAFAFTQREDFDTNNLAGVVNIDLLGRNAYEVIENSLFIAGTNGYTDLRAKLTENPTKLNILPVDMGIIGARGDHVAFDDMDACVLFFSSGLYEDYHRPGDTADKLNYAAIQASAEVINKAVVSLANAPERLSNHGHLPHTQEELQALYTCLNHIHQDPNTLHMTPAEVNAVSDLAADVASYCQGQSFTSQAQRQLVFDNFDILARLSSWPEDPCDPNEYPEEAYTDFLMGYLTTIIGFEYRSELVAAGRELTNHLTQHQKRLYWGMPDFKYKNAILKDDFMSLIPTDANQYILSGIGAEFSIEIRFPGLLQWPPRYKLDYSAGLTWLPKATQGSPAEILDTCLLGWGRTISENEPNAYYAKFVQMVTGKDEDWDHQTWLDWRLKQGPWANEEQWMQHTLTSQNPYLLSASLRRLPKKPDASYEPLLINIFQDPNTHPNIRINTIKKVHKQSQASTLLTLIQQLDDTTQLEHLIIQLKKDHPQAYIKDFINSAKQKSDALWAKIPQKKKAKPRKKKREDVPNTIGEYALKQLKKTTGKDFGQDKAAWTAWVEKHH